MTRKEAKRRLKFIAEWWEPEVMGRKPDGTGMCVLEAAGDACGTDAAKSALGLGNVCCYSIWRNWDRCDRAAALRAIEEL